MQNQSNIFHFLINKIKEEQNLQRKCLGNQQNNFILFAAKFMWILAFEIRSDAKFRKRKCLQRCYNLFMLYMSQRNQIPQLRLIMKAELIVSKLSPNYIYNSL